MSERSRKIAELNDAFRTTFVGGRVMMTRGIQHLPEAVRGQIMRQVTTFNAFTEDNDPYGEHDFGSVEVDGAGKIFWKIDYYDLNLEFGSEDPSDPSVTTRVLTIMLANEY